MGTEDIISENEFLKKLIKCTPASIHVLEINEQCETRPFWIGEEYTRITGFDPIIRKQMGFVAPEEFYHEEDAPIVRELTRLFVIGQNEKFAMFLRFKRSVVRSEWVYVRGARIRIEEGKHHMVVVLFPINDQAVHSQLKVDLYTKEINRLKHQLTLSKLTKTELNVLEMLGKGLSTKEVANQLCRSYDTVNNHRRSIFSKLGIHKISDLVSLAKEAGLV